MVSQDSYQVAALNLTLGNIAAGDRADPLNIENLPDIDSPLGLLAERRFQHTFHGRPDVSHCFVNDGIEPYVNTFLRRQSLAFGFRTDIKSNHNGIRGRGQKNIALGDAANRTMNDSQFYF